MKKQNVYKKVVDVTSSYLGPAADRFISRQIETHLNKKPNELTREDIYKLTDCVKVAIALLTGDGKIVDSYTQSLLELSKK
jgi:hypothetical protein